jgi:TolB-like protein/DNA-binding winged helix-turn-helix (wHTH) protein
VTEDSFSIKVSRFSYGEACYERPMNNAAQQILRFDRFALDLTRGCLRCGDQEVALRPKAFEMLRYLAQNAGRLIPKQEIYEAVWPDVTVSDDSITQCIWELREKLGDNDHSLIKTVSRRGYLLDSDVSAETPDQLAVAATEGPKGMESLASPGAICLSEDVRLDSAPERPALVLPEKPSIAVLPFQNISGDPEQEYLCDGMVEEIITGLSRIKWLFVIARNSASTYKGRAVDVKQVGRELGVRYVLEGSLRKAADRVRVTGQLIDAATGAHLWAERYDHKSDDIFALQDEITLSVVGAIEPSLRLAEIERVKRKRSDSLDAYDLVLRAHSDVYSRIPERSTKALLLLERALVFDPTYGLAHAYAAQCYHSLFIRGGLREENRTASIRHAEAAIAYGHDDASALAFAGFVVGMDKHDRAAAFAAFDAALAVSPSSAITYIVGSVILAFGGEAERAIEWAGHGLRLSPFDPYRASAFCSVSLGHYHRGQYAEAVDAARKAIQATPGFSVCHMVLVAPLVKLGRLEEAKAAAARLLELQPAFSCSKQMTGVGCAPALAASLSEALRTAGLPE